MPLQPSMPTSLALAPAEHPTVCEVVVGDRKLPVLRERSTVLSRFKNAAIRPGDRTLLRTVFQPSGARRSADPSTTLVAHQTGTPPVLHFQLADGRRFQLAMRQELSHVLFSLGRQRDREWIWTGWYELPGLRDAMALHSPFFRELHDSDSHAAPTRPII